jgi:IS30 family transposase
MKNFKHFSINERTIIEQSLKIKKSLREIASSLNRHPSSVSREIKSHLIIRETGAYGRPFNNCLFRYDCGHICKKQCSDFTEEICTLFSKPPYVCNGCFKKSRCTLRKRFYSAKAAQNESHLVLTETRNGIDIDEKEISRIDGIISPLIFKGQSIHHICINNKDVIMHSEKSIYNYIDYGLLSAINLDLPRKVRYRPRKKLEVHFKVDKACRIGRTYKDFLEFMYANPDTPVVEMDTVEGKKGGKVLLTIHFTEPQLMLSFIRKSNTSRSVTEIFQILLNTLKTKDFCRLFPIILTDNGSEFSNPAAIEFDEEGKRLTYVFYCNPSSPYQKGAIENNHELIRRIIPKGESFDPYGQDKISKMMNHINSYTRKKLNDKSPLSVFSFFHGSDMVEKLGLECIPSNDIILNPDLLK